MFNKAAKRATVARLSRFENQTSNSTKNRKYKRNIQKHPETSRNIQKHPETSRNIQKHPETSRNIQKYRIGPGFLWLHSSWPAPRKQCRGRRPQRAMDQSDSQEVPTSRSNPCVEPTARKNQTIRIHLVLSNMASREIPQKTGALLGKSSN